MRTSKWASTTMIAIAVSSCGGSGGSPSSGPPLSDSTGAGDTACAGDYYRTVIGIYRGQIDYDASAASAEGGSVCAWDAVMEIRARNLGTSLCELDATVTSTVEQSVVLPATSESASECLAESAVLRVFDPMRGRTNPVLGVDYTLPIRLRFGDLAPPPTSGPYFGDAASTVPYVRPFGGVLPVAETLVINEDGITLEQFNPSPESGVISGSLERLE